MTAKRKLFAFIIAGVIATLVTVMGAQSEVRTASSSGQHLEGSWFFTVTPEGMPPATDLITFTMDGGLIESLNDPSFKSSAGDAHGAWVRTGDGEFAFTWLRFLFDFPPGPGDGKFTATVKVRGRVKLNETSDRLSGPFKFDVFDPTGKVVFSSSGTAQGVRIVVESF